MSNGILQTASDGTHSSELEPVAQTSLCRRGLSCDDRFGFLFHALDAVGERCGDGVAFVEALDFGSVWGEEGFGGEGAVD